MLPVTLKIKADRCHEDMVLTVYRSGIDILIHIAHISVAKIAELPVYPQEQAVLVEAFAYAPMRIIKIDKQLVIHHPGQLRIECRRHAGTHHLPPAVGMLAEVFAVTVFQA